MKKYLMITDKPDGCKKFIEVETQDELKILWIENMSKHNQVFMYKQIDFEIEEMEMRN